MLVPLRLGLEAIWLSEKKIGLIGSDSSAFSVEPAPSGLDRSESPGRRKVGRQIHVEESASNGGAVTR